MRDENIRPAMSAMEASQNDLATPIVNAIESLYSKHRRRILIELQESNSLSYTELKERIGLVKGTFNYHLKKLSGAGMVRNFSLEQEETSFVSYYEISELGKRIVDGIYSAYKPPSPKMRFSGSAYTWDLEVIGGTTADTEREEAPDITSTSPSGEEFWKKALVIAR